MKPGKSTENKPKIVCLCGSTRFKSSYELATQHEELCGRIALTIGFHKLSLEQKELVDTLHLRRIDLADEVLVIDMYSDDIMRSYIGESTTNEVRYAREKGKPVRYLSEEIDEW